MQPEKLILASGSPRRKELLTALGLSFDVCVSDVLEDDRAELNPKDLVLNNAILKAESVMPKFANALVVGSDTTVSLEGTIFSKPSNLDEAAAMLSTLSGRWHQVYTAVSLRWMEGSYAEDFYEVSDVCFKLTPNQRVPRIVNPWIKQALMGSKKKGIVSFIHSWLFETIMGFPTKPFSALKGRV